MNTRKELQELFARNKQTDLIGRFINNDQIIPIIDSLPKKVKRIKVGKSVLKKPIYKLEIGYGEKRVLMWSQMHGNESTTTKAIFDLISTLVYDSSELLKSIIKSFTICIIPTLNPDGAENFSRYNASNVDLNRDAQDLSQPESLILNSVFRNFKPDYCFNLHDQRTIFGVGNSNKPATVSFLVPSQDEEKSLTNNRIKAMELVVAMNNLLQQIIPGQVGIYDDTFNLNCVGDTFQTNGIPTILFEAGHFGYDYNREFTRELIYCSLIKVLEHIVNQNERSMDYRQYFEIPQNKKSFFDVILRNALYKSEIQDIGIQFEEVLENKRIQFYPRIKMIGNLENYFGHKEFLLDEKEVKIEDGDSKQGNEVYVINKNSEKKHLKLKDF